MITPEQLFDFLQKLNIKIKTYNHEAVFTVEEAKKHLKDIPGGHCKTLFLKNKKGQLWLLVLLDHQRVDFKKLKKLLAVSSLSFSNEELLWNKLKVKPGSVSPFALINDQERDIQVLLDKQFIEHDLVNYHPLVNTMTSSIAVDDLIYFIQHLGYEAKWIDLIDYSLNTITKK